MKSLFLPLLIALCGCTCVVPERCGNTAESSPRPSIEKIHYRVDIREKPDGKIYTVFAKSDYGNIEIIDLGSAVNLTYLEDGEEFHLHGDGLIDTNFVREISDKSYTSLREYGAGKSSGRDIVGIELGIHFANEKFMTYIELKKVDGKFIKVRQLQLDPSLLERRRKAIETGEYIPEPSNN